MTWQHLSWLLVGVSSLVIRSTRGGDPRPIMTGQGWCYCSVAANRFVTTLWSLPRPSFWIGGIQALSRVKNKKTLLGTQTHPSTHGTQTHPSRHPRRTELRRGQPDLWLGPGRQDGLSTAGSAKSASKHHPTYSNWLVTMASIQLSLAGVVPHIKCIYN